MVTVVGVAYRGGIPLENIAVDFAVEPIAAAAGPGFGVRETVRLQGKLSETERVRLERAVRFCPVGQALTKGSMQFEDVVEWGNGETRSLPPDAADSQSPTGSLPAIPPGTVQARYLLDTKEYDADGKMADEGESKIYISAANLTGAGRWTLLSGHSSPGWVPPPFPTAQAAWAASTVATLTGLLPFPDAKAARDLRVEVGLLMRGGRERSQGDAAAGNITKRPALRRLIVPGRPDTLPAEKIAAALARDPITIAYRGGGVLLDEQVVVE